MKLSDKVRYLREVEGGLRSLGRAMTQGELVRALRAEMRESLSQSYISQIESGTRPHLTNTSRLLLAKFFKVHPGYLVDDPEGYHAELPSGVPDFITKDIKLDVWLATGAKRFGRDPELGRALLAVARHPDSRGCLLLLGTLLGAPNRAECLSDLLHLSEGEPGSGSKSQQSLTSVESAGSSPRRSATTQASSRKGAAL